MGDLDWRLGSEGSRSSQLCTKTFGTESRPAEPKLQARRSAQHEVGIGRRVPVQLPYSVAICLLSASVSFLSFPVKREREFSAKINQGSLCKRPWHTAAFHLGLSQISRGESEPAPQAGESSLAEPTLEATRARYLIGLSGGFRRRISARQLRNREYSAMLPRCQGRRRLPPQSALLSPRARPPRGGAPAGPMRARRRLPPPRGSQPTDAHPPSRLSPPFPDPSPGLCKRSSPLSLYCLRYLLLPPSRLGRTMENGWNCQRVEVCNPLANRRSQTQVIARLPRFR